MSNNFGGFGRGPSQFQQNQQVPSGGGGGGGRRVAPSTIVIAVGVVLALLYKFDIIEMSVMKNIIVVGFLFMIVSTALTGKSNKGQGGGNNPNNYQ